MDDKDFLSGPASINIEDVMKEIRVRLADSNVSSTHAEINGFRVVQALPDNSAERLDEILSQNTRSWDIDINWPITSHRPVIGPVLAFVKRVVRKLLRWYIARPWEQQITFNASVMEILQGITGEVKQGLKSSEENNAKMMAELKRYVDESAKGISDELLFITQRPSRLGHSTQDTQKAQETQAPVIEASRSHSAASVPVPTTVAAPAVVNQVEFDYFMFEQCFRGSTKEIRERQRVYLDYFKDKHEVLDLGCGRGEFLELMRDSGIKATGLDTNSDMVAYVRGLGLAVEEVDVRTYLKDVPRSIDGIFAAQLIEHLTPAEMLNLIRICYDKLESGGTLALETVNPTCLSVFGESFYMDLSHIRPVHPATLAFALKQEGFINVQTLYLSPFADNEKIPNLPIAGCEAFNAGIERLNSRLFGFRDYAIIGEKR